MKYIKLLGFMGLLIGLMVVAVNCTATPAASETEPEPTEVSGTEPEPPEALGGTWFIMEVNKGGEKGTVGEILLQSGQLGGDTAIVTITGETQIFELNMGELIEESFSALKVGVGVDEVWTTGPVLGSTPAEATAIKIVLSCPICGLGT